MGGAAGLPAWIVPSALGAASNAGQTYDEAVAAGQDPEKAKRAAITGALIGLTEGLGVGRLGGGHAASHGVVRAITGKFLEEGFQEGFLNQALNNINAKIVSGYDPNRAISEGVLESFGLGGFVGGTLGVVGAGHPSRSERYAAALNAKPMEAIRPPSPMIPPATPKQTEIIRFPSGPPPIDSGTAAPAANTAPISAAAPTIGGEPVSARWLNAQRQQVGQMLGLAPDQIPMVEGQPTAANEMKSPGVGAAPKNLADLLGGAGKTIAENLRQALRQSVEKNGRLPAAEKGSLLDQVFEAAAARGAPRNADPLNKAIPLAEQGAQAARQQFDQVFPAGGGQADAPGAATTTKPNGQIFASGLGFLQQFFERPGGDTSSKTGSRRGRVFETVGAAQTAAQLTSIPFVLRNAIQHASHGAQELATQGVAGLIDKAAAKVTGKREVGGFSNPLDAVKEIGRTGAPFKDSITGKKVKAVRQKATEFDLDFADGTSAAITLAAETSSVMLRNEAGQLEYAD